MPLYMFKLFICICNCDKLQIEKYIESKPHLQAVFNNLNYRKSRRIQRVELAANTRGGKKGNDKESQIDLTLRY